MQQIVLRPDQVKLKSDIYNSWNAGNRNVLAVAVTGFGKTILSSDVTLDHHNAGQKVAIVAHRNELVSQMSLTVARRGIPHRIIGSDSTVAAVVRKHREKLGKSFVNPSALTGVVGVDTMMSRTEDLKDWAKQISLWQIDEAHHAVGNWEVDAHGSMIYKSDNTPQWRTDPNKWGKCSSMFTNARGLGLTATPSRADGQGLGWEYDGVFHSMVQGPDMRWLIDNGMLSEYELVCPESDFRIDEDKRGKDGDFTHMEMRKASKNSHLVGDVVSNYARYAYGRRAIVFATDIETANEMAIRFQQFGIRAASVNGKSATAYREQCINEFSAGKIQVLINVDLFDEGFDVPACDVIIMARPTASLGKYLQMVGRGLRYMPGKTALIIDHVSNIIRHHLPDKKRIWTLARRDKRAKMRKDPDELELRTCKGCRKPYEAFRIACPYCGTEKPLPMGGGRSVEQVEGDLVLLDKATLDRMRAATTLENAADVGNRVGAAAGAIAGKGAANRQIEKITAHMQLQETIAQWAGYERAKGYSDREIHKRFYLTAGVDILTALDGSHGRKEYDTINEVVKGWMN